MLKFDLQFSKGVEINTISVYQTLRKAIQNSPKRSIQSLCNDELNSSHLYEQLWTLHRLISTPDSNWIMIGNDHSHVIDFLDSVAKFSQAKLIFDVFAGVQNWSQLSERMAKEYLEALKTKSGPVVFVFTQADTLNKDNLDYFCKNFKYPANLTPELESALVDLFISQLPVSFKYKYLKAKSPNELDRELICEEAKKIISRKIKLSVLLTDHFSYAKFVKSNPAVFSYWTKFCLEEWNQNVCFNLSQNILQSETHSTTSNESKAKLILNLYTDLKEEYHRLFYSSRGALTLANRETQQKSESLTPSMNKSEADNLVNFWNRLALEDESHKDPFGHFKDRLSHSLPVEDCYFSNEKFIILHKVYIRLYDRVEKSLKQTLEETNFALKNFQEVWNHYQRNTNQKSKGLVRDTEIQLKIHDLSRSIEEKEQIIISKTAGIDSKQKEIAQFESQKERINYNLSTFGTQIAVFVKKLLKNLEKISDSQFDQFTQEIKAKDKKSRLFPLVEILCVSLLNKSDILTESDQEAQSLLLKMVAAKYEFLRVIGKYNDISHETFVLLDPKSMSKLERNISKLSELREEDQTPFVKTLIEWCNYYFKQILYLQELRFLEERMRSRKSEMQNSFEFVQTFSESIKTLTFEIEDMKKKITLLTEEHSNLKINLENSELGQSRVELLINSLKVIENKYQNRRVKYMKMLESLSHDLIIIAMNVVLLGNLSNPHKFEITNRLVSKSNYYASQNSAKFSQDWTFNEIFLEKTYKRMLKVLGGDSLLNAVWSSKFIHSYARLKFV